MTRQECEKKLVDLMEQAYQIFGEYCPGRKNLSLFGTDDGYIAIGIGYTGNEGKLMLDGFKSANGNYKFSEV